jgi:sortase B
MKKKICIILIAAFALLFSTSVYFIFDHYRQEAQQAELYDSLADMVDCAADTEEETTEPILYTDEKTVLPELAELYQQNGDLAGWIRIEDTNINYPVMHTPDNPDFYLKHGFDKEYSDYGCPYVQENCDVQLPSDNVILYGHHMKNGSMFADLEMFKNQDFWQEHKIISFSTVTDRYEYEIISVFKTFVYSDSPEAFKYYHFVSAEMPEDFSAYIDRCKELSLYDTGVSAEYGDKLITLSTCEYSRTNGRLVVVAKRISD